VNDILFILSPVIFMILGVAALVLPKSISKILPLIAVAISVGFFAYTPAYTGMITFDWIGNAALQLTATVTPVRLIFFAMLILSLFIYGIATLNSKSREDGFALIAAGGMGTVLFSGDLLTLFIGWEIMAWGSFLPLLSRGEDPKAARRYLVYSLFGAASLLAGVLLIGSNGGTYLLSSITANTAAVGMPFLLVGFLLKSGMMPLHRWVPSTYKESPDLFAGFMSAALSKAGVFGLILTISLVPISGTLFAGAIAWIGTLTALFATFRAIREEELKGLLTWSSISQVGYIVTSIAIGSSLGVAGGIYHAINHTIIKILLFTVVAGIIARTGKTRFDQLGGLIYKMPFSFIAVLMGIIALAGMPPLGGFASKWLIYSALLEQGEVLLLVVVIAASTAAFLYNFKLIYGIFLGQPTEVQVSTAKEIGWGYRLSLIVPLGLLMAIGMFPSALFTVINPILTEIGLAQIVQGNYAVISTSLGSYNGLFVMETFGGAFAIILILFSMVKSKSRDLHHLDIAYCGETPTESTPLHYGFGVGRELIRIPFVGFWMAKSTQNFYNWIHSMMNQLASLVRLMFSGNMEFYFGTAFITALVLWVLAGGNA